MVTGHRHETDVPASKLKRCTEVLDDTSLLSDADLWLIRFTSEYYHHPIGEVVSAALPTLLRHGKALHPLIQKIVATSLAEQTDVGALARRAPKQAELLEALLDARGDGLETDHLSEMLPNWRRASKGLAEKGLIATLESRAAEFAEVIVGEKQPGPDLNSDQQRALSVLRSSDHFAAYLLDGVTGSGKTEVYLQRVQDVLDLGKQALLLVPEIGLTPQLVDRLRNRLGVEPALIEDLNGIRDLID